MLSTNAIKGIEFCASLQRQKLSAEEEINLLEHRRKLLKKILENWSLPTLGKFLDVEPKFVKVVGDKGLSLTTPGIFQGEYLATLHTSSADGTGNSITTSKAWGLIRDCEWVVVTIQWKDCSGHGKAISSLTIRRVDVATLLKEGNAGFRGVMGKLDHEIDELLKLRKQRYREILDVSEARNIQRLIIAGKPWV